MRDDRCRPSLRRHDHHRLATVLAATLAFGGCYAHGKVRPTAVPSGPKASVVRLYLAQPRSVTGTFTPSRAASELQDVTVQAATGLAGRIVWTSGDSLDIEVRAAMHNTHWQRFDWAPTMRIAWQDVVSAEGPKIAPARTAATVGLLVGLAFLVSIAISLAGMADEDY